MAEEEEVDVLLQRVVKDINNAFKRNPNIDEVGLIACPEARYNRSPVVLVDNKLGLESWCVKLLLPYVHNRLLRYRQHKLWLDREALLDITCTLLLLNPDFTTAWNVRKELLQSGALRPERDLYLGQLALTKFPKSPETWIHRRWVLQQVLREGCVGDRKLPVGPAPGPAPQDRLQRTLNAEMKVCSDAAGRYPSNYNAWSHRIWVLENMAKGNLKVLHDELYSMRVWVSMHVSDHSGFHYRQFLLKALVQELSQSPGSPPPSPDHQANGEGGATPLEGLSWVAGAPQLFQQEMELCSDLIQAYPGHETLWSHRRHVFYLWHHWRREHPGQDSPHPNTPTRGSSPPLSPASQSGLALEEDGDPLDTKRLRRGPPLPSELGFVAGVLDGCSTEQGRFARAYRKWLDSVIGQ
ncbi:protein prenyltransferase alpha subunit repeat-containing protein 1 [Osmerus mordax]|uniref:protein prenyltransferase alpha subunit repeat-containing protein 1 n=1 Tax=Osmerus mordax TaxID=8014 RepID=UPI00350ED045